MLGLIKFPCGKTFCKPMHEMVSGSPEKPTDTTAFLVLRHIIDFL